MILFSEFSSIVLLARHLANFCGSFSALVPRGNMVGFHFKNIKLFFADRTSALLPLVCFSLSLIDRYSCSIKKFDASRMAVFPLPFQPINALSPFRLMGFASLPKYRKFLLVRVVINISGYRDPSTILISSGARL